jgi:hypothetical protein
MYKTNISIIALPILLLLNGCASTIIGVHPGADRVSLAEASQVSTCQSKGKTIVTVLSKIGIFDRLEENVEEDLYQVARNNAVDDGADTIVKGESTQFGKRTFSLYKCRP